jgi:chorismate synthase
MILSGIPAGETVDLDALRAFMARRAPGNDKFATARKEPDEPVFLSGLDGNITNGDPIEAVIYNKNQRSGDYEEMKNLIRPSHADFTYQTKYGIRDYAGGGRTSARTTIAQVAGGAFAKLLLNKVGIKIYSYTSQVGDIKLEKCYSDLDLNKIDDNPVRCPDSAVAEKMAEKIMEIKNAGDTIGGVISSVIKGCPVGLGEPRFDKLHARLAYAMLSINAVKGFEYGCGFNGVSKKGSELNDVFIPTEKGIGTKSNNSGGIQGGISNGEDIYFNVAFKPVPTLLMDQETVDIHGNPTTFKARGRHDACVLPRAVPIVDAMAALTIADAYLIAKSNQLGI